MQMCKRQWQLDERATDRARVCEGETNAESWRAPRPVAVRRIIHTSLTFSIAAVERRCPAIRRRRCSSAHPISKCNARLGRREVVIVLAVESVIDVDKLKSARSRARQVLSVLLGIGYDDTYATWALHSAVA